MLHDLIDSALDSGPLRHMFPACTLGRKINRIRAQVTPKVDEDPLAYHNRLKARVGLLGATEKCLSYESCALCPRAKDILARAASKRLYCQDHHARTVFDQMTLTGQTRLLPNTCSIGRTMNALLANGDADGVSDVAVAALGDKYDCATMTSCMHCALGRGVVENLLLDLAQNGLDGDAGKELKEHAGYLW